MSDWKQREKEAARDLGMTPHQYRVLLITRIWPYWLIGQGPRLRKQLAQRQGGHCAMYRRKTCRREFIKGEVLEVHHIRPKMHFVADNVPIRVAIKRCWADKNLQLVHIECHSRITRA
jgi:hypothetical protein